MYYCHIIFKKGKLNLIYFLFFYSFIYFIYFILFYFFSIIFLLTIKYENINKMSSYRISTRNVFGQSGLNYTNILL